jgi:hypothetical protein
LKAREKAFCALSDRFLKRGMVQKKGGKKGRKAVTFHW